MEQQEPSKCSQAPAAYEKPELVCYGTIALLTNSSGSANGDGGQNMMTTNSDLHYKQNIVRVGTHPLGFGLYLFDYKPEFTVHGAGRQFGVIAQEVENVVPDAIVLGEDGYRRVDYAKLGILRSAH